MRTEKANDGLEALSIAAVSRSLAVGRGSAEAPEAPHGRRSMARIWHLRRNSLPPTHHAGKRSRRLPGATPRQAYPGNPAHNATQASRARPSDVDLASTDALLSGDYTRLVATAPPS